jgi:hypothetical protein
MGASSRCGTVVHIRECRRHDHVTHDHRDARVRDALDDLRSVLGAGDRIDFAELLTIGARTKMPRLRAHDDATRGARTRLAQMVRARALPVDLDAADAVKQVRLMRNDHQ